MVLILFISIDHVCDSDWLYLVLEMPPLGTSELTPIVFIMELVSSQIIVEKTEPSFIVGPLSVAYQATGKKRLIIDLSRLNKFVQKVQTR